jgi:hypothetical protein
MIDIQEALELKSTKNYDCAGIKPAGYEREFYDTCW